MDDLRLIGDPKGDSAAFAGPYNGFALDSFLGRPDFAEVAWVLACGRSPLRQDLERFKERLAEQDDPEEIDDLMRMLPTAPGTVLLATKLDVRMEQPESLESALTLVMARARATVAGTYRKSVGRPFVFPHPRLGYCANVFQMTFSEPSEGFVMSGLAEDAANLFFILNAVADAKPAAHSGDRSNVLAWCLEEAALWQATRVGGGLRVLEMLDSIRRSDATPQDYLDLVRRGRAVLHGFASNSAAHSDGRVRALRTACEELIAERPQERGLLDCARRLEEAVRADPCWAGTSGGEPTLDLYSGILLRALGAPDEMLAQMLAVARVPAWVGEWWRQGRQAS